MSSRPTEGDGLDDEAVEALLRADAGGDVLLAECLNKLRAQGVGPAPVPSAELLALLEHGVPDDLADRRGIRRPVRAATVVVAAAGVLGVSGVAAAHDDLPGPVGRVVTDIVERTTPFSVAPALRQSPRSTGHGDHRSVAPATVEPAVAQRPDDDGAAPTTGGRHREPEPVTPRNGHGGSAHGSGGSGRSGDSGSGHSGSGHSGSGHSGSGHGGSGHSGSYGSGHGSDDRSDHRSGEDRGSTRGSGGDPGSGDDGGRHSDGSSRSGHGSTHGSRQGGSGYHRG